LLPSSASNDAWLCTAGAAGAAAAAAAAAVAEAAEGGAASISDSVGWAFLPRIVHGPQGVDGPESCTMEKIFDLPKYYDKVLGINYIAIMLST
jgi:hypothetical protein